MKVPQGSVNNYQHTFLTYDLINKNGEIKSQNDFEVLINTLGGECARQPLRKLKLYMNAAGQV